MDDKQAILAELEEAWKEDMPDAEGRIGESFGGGGDSSRRHFAYGYLAAKRRYERAGVMTGFEEWRRLWNRGIFMRDAMEHDNPIIRELWAAALANVQQGSDWADELSKLIPWEKVNSTNVVVCAYDQTGTQIINFGKINRPLPQTVELTDDEKLHQVEQAMKKLSEDSAIAVVRALNKLLLTKTLDELCKEYGVETTRSV